MTDAEIASLLGDHFVLTPYGPEGFLNKLKELGLRVIEDQPDHIIEFGDNGWQIMHSVECRMSGRLLDCAIHRAVVRDIHVGTDTIKAGRYRVTVGHLSGMPVYEKLDGRSEV
jgi:hypothetical protein